MGRHHAVAIDRAGGTVVAVVDPQLELAQRLARSAAAVRTLDELAAAPRTIDVVHVCTPPSSHVELVQQAIALGAHVVVEKPVAPDGATTAALVASASKRGVTLVPVHQFLFQPGVQRILAAQERFGTIVRCAFHAASAGAAATGMPPDDLVAEILPHPLALFSGLAPVPVSDLEWTVTRPAAGELRAVSVSNGTTFEIVISARARPARAELEVFGTQASARADLFHGFAVFEPGAVSRIRKAARPFAVAGTTLLVGGANLAGRAMRRETAYPGLRELVRTTYNSISTGSPAAVTMNETVSVAVARDAILRGVGVQAPG
jgi:predicted dehydrogenase